jgi:F420-0:gamma-glutamyl ligase
MEVTKANILDGLAAAAVAVMGEGSEQTPIAVIRDTPFVTFVERPPSEKEINDMRIPLELDLYAPILSSVSWQKGKINEIK